MQWCPELVAGQLRFMGNSLDLGIPDMTLQQAVAAGVKSLVIGVAPTGGAIDGRWIALLEEAAQSGIDGRHRLRRWQKVHCACTDKKP